MSTSESDTTSLQERKLRAEIAKLEAEAARTVAEQAAEVDRLMAETGKFQAEADEIKRKTKEASSARGIATRWVVRAAAAGAALAVSWFGIVEPTINRAGVVADIARLEAEKQALVNDSIASAFAADTARLNAQYQRIQDTLWAVVDRAAQAEALSGLEIEGLQRQIDDLRPGPTVLIVTQPLRRGGGVEVTDLTTGNTSRLTVLGRVAPVRLPYGPMGYAFALSDSLGAPVTCRGVLTPMPDQVAWSAACDRETGAVTFRPRSGN